MTTISARIGLTFALVALSSPALSATPEDVARAALARSPVVDGHNDVPEQLRSRFGNDFSKFDFHDMSPPSTQKGGKMHTDLARLRKGMVGGQFWSVWVTTVHRPERSLCSPGSYRADRRRRTPGGGIPEGPDACEECR